MPSAQDIAGFRQCLQKGASALFNASTGLPLQSSPVRCTLLYVCLLLLLCENISFINIIIFDMVFVRLRCLGQCVFFLMPISLSVNGLVYTLSVKWGTKAKHVIVSLTFCLFSDLLGHICLSSCVSLCVCACVCVIYPVFCTLSEAVCSCYRQH